jgi:hypothetical protein
MFQFAGNTFSGRTQNLTLITDLFSFAKVIFLEGL